MPMSDSLPDASVFFSHLRLAYPSANLRLYAECQVQLHKDDKPNKGIREKLSLLVGVGAHGLEARAEDLCDVVESSLRHADFWEQLPLKPVPRSGPEASNQSCFCIIFRRTDSHLLSRYNTSNSAISRIHLTLLYTQTAHHFQSTTQTHQREQDNDMLDPGSPNPESTHSFCIFPAAISLLDLALRTLILGKRPRAAIKGLVLESHHIQKSLADLDPLSFRLGYSSSLIDRSAYIGRIAETLCDIQQRASSDALKAAFARVTEGRDDRLRGMLEQNLFRIAEDVLRDAPAGAKRLKPVVLRYALEVPAPVGVGSGVEITDKFTSLFESASPEGSEAALEAAIEQDGDGDDDGEAGRFTSLFDQDDAAEPIFGPLFEDTASSPFDSLFEDDDDGDEDLDDDGQVAALPYSHPSTYEYEVEGEQAHCFLFDSDEVLLDDDWDEEVAPDVEREREREWERDYGEYGEYDDDELQTDPGVRALEYALLF